MNQEKLKYFEPQIKIVRLKTEDIITISGNHNDIPENPGIELPVDPLL